jgi:hypothetical protein
VETSAIERRARIDIASRGCLQYVYLRLQTGEGKITLLLSPIQSRATRQVDNYGYGTGHRVGVVFCPLLFPPRSVADKGTAEYSGLQSELHTTIPVWWLKERFLPPVTAITDRFRRFRCAVEQRCREQGWQRTSIKLKLELDSLVSGRCKMACAQVFGKLGDQGVCEECLAGDMYAPARLALYCTRTCTYMEGCYLLVHILRVVSVPVRTMYL